MSTPPLASVPLLSVLTPFAVAFTAPTFRHVLVPVTGTILASGRRTVARRQDRADHQHLDPVPQALAEDVLKDPQDRYNPRRQGSQGTHFLASGCESAAPCLTSSVYEIDEG
jgi:hypothetical protein